MILKSHFNTIEIKSSVVKSLLNYTQIDSTDKEAGGVLLGRSLMNNNIIINDISVPQHRDTRSRYFFRKSKSDHQIIVDNYWKGSKGYINYLGEWHTHPEKIPKPSSIDLESWMLNLELNKNEIPSHVYIIVGVVEIGVWQGIKESKIIKHVGYFKIN